MLNNLFASFDSKNYMFYFIFILNIYVMLFFSLTKKINMFNIFKKMYFKFIYFNVSENFFFMVIFTIIFSMNFLSLNMYGFNLTSQISINLYLIISLWMPITMISLTKMNNSFLIHIVPMGTSNILIPMMVLIELLSFFIRPLTLFLRLTINMIAGHVLVNLINKVILNNNMYFYMVIYMYMLMKFLVSFIQSYIITTLLKLYIEEI